MKRNLSTIEHDDDHSGTKKRRIEVTPDPQPLQLPSEIWEHILSLNNSNDIKEVICGQRALRATSKEYFQITMNTWRAISAKKWPKFHNAFIKLLDDEKFVACYRKLMIFSESELDPLEEYIEGKAFWEDQCPICNQEMMQSGKFGQISQCMNCLSKYGANIEWKRDFDSIICDGCAESTPLYFFECDICQRKMGPCCSSKYNQDKAPYHGDCERQYCTKCTVDCEHCDIYCTFTTNNKCPKCARPLCEECAYYDDCPEAPLDNKEEDDSSGDDKDNDGVANDEVPTERTDVVPGVPL